MEFYDLEYFSNDERGLCASAFENEQKYIKINLTYLVSLSALEKFTTPFTGKYIGKFSTVKMISGDIFYIKEASYNNLMQYLYTLNSKT